MTWSLAQIEALIQSAAAQAKLPGGPSLLRALLHQESGLNPNVPDNHNSNGSYDRGIAQINSQAHPEVSDAQAMDPAFAIPWAANYLAAQIRGCGSISGGLQSYNSGSCDGAPGYAQAVLAQAGPGVANAGGGATWYEPWTWGQGLEGDINAVESEASKWLLRGVLLALALILGVAALKRVA